MSDRHQMRVEIGALVDRHPYVELHLVWEGPGQPLVLHLIRTMPVWRGHGLAEAALTDVVQLADRHGLVLVLHPEPIEGDDDTDLGRLLGWYQRHGLTVVDQTPNRDEVHSIQHRAVVMRRYPRSS